MSCGMHTHIKRARKGTRDKMRWANNGDADVGDKQRDATLGDDTPTLICAHVHMCTQT